MNNCYMFTISTNTLVPKENMINRRSGHCVQKIAQKIFAFGGYDDRRRAMKSAEVYDIIQNSWKSLPDMP